MEVLQAITERRSTKGFKSDPVPKEILLKLLDTCKWAPSAQNTQPWDFYVLGGPVMQEVQKRLTEKVTGKVTPNPDIPAIDLYDPYLKRSNELKNGIDSYQFPPGTKNLDQKRAAYLVNGGRFFNAPNGIIVCVEKKLAPRLIIDAGIIAQTIALTAFGMGLGSCIMARTTYFPEILRDLLKIPESKLIVIGLAIGYPDPTTPLNSCPRKRVDTNELVHWCGI
jgi:nitroreductase